MEVRYTPNPDSYKRMDTSELRKSFLLENLFIEDEIVLTYFDVDRLIAGSAIPIKKTLQLSGSKDELAAEYFAQRREIGIINIGGEGYIKTDDIKHSLQYKDALYVGRGTRLIEFSSKAEENPAKFYILSYPAHADYPTSHIKFADAEPVKLGSSKDVNKRVIYKYIHLNGIRSCQLVMGLTELEKGSIWNTMPAHLHQRRSEIYMYFNLVPDSVVFHIMGLPEETRNLVVRNQQAVLSPSWSIHCGATTQNYSFIWAMGGENQTFEDMDPVEMGRLK